MEELLPKVKQRRSYFHNGTICVEGQTLNLLEINDTSIADGQIKVRMTDGKVYVFKAEGQALQINYLSTIEKENNLINEAQLVLENFELNNSLI